MRGKSVIRGLVISCIHLKMSNVIWTYSALGSYDSPGNPWSEEEELTYSSVFQRGYEDYKVLQGILAILVCILCKRRRRYAKLGVPQAVEGNAVLRAKTLFPEQEDRLNRYMAERYVLLLLGIDLPSALVLYHVIDHMNELIDQGIYRFEDEVIFPLQSDLYNKQFIMDSGIIVWLLNNGYVGPLISWRLAFMVDDSDFTMGDRLIDKIEISLMNHREDISFVILTIDNRYNENEMNELLRKYEGIDTEDITNEDLEINYDARKQFGSQWYFQNIGSADPFPDIRSPHPLPPWDRLQTIPESPPTSFDDIVTPSNVSPNLSPISTPISINDTLQEENRDYNRVPTGKLKRAIV